MKHKYVGIVSLFTSTSTLICCALPVTIATIAGGAAVATLVGHFPFLVTISYYKGWIFLMAGIFLAIGFYFTFRPGQSCPTDTEKREACETTTKASKIILWISLGIYVVGVTFAYVIPLFM